MNPDDTRTTPAATRAADNAAAPGELRRVQEADRTTAGLLARTYQARFVAVARQAVALGLARAGAERFTRIAMSSFPHGFPDGSDYGALCPQDDLTKEQAQSIHAGAVQAVQAEARHMTQNMTQGDPRTAAVVTAQLADWEEGAAIEWAAMKRIREELDEEDEEEKQKTAVKEAREQSPGWQYVHTYLLEEVDNNADTSWLAESINDGRLIACPRCHFLHLPFQPFPLPAKALTTPPLDACDVCAMVPLYCDPINWGGEWEKALPSAQDDLFDERTARAIQLYEFWIGTTNGADALRVAAIAEGLAGLVKQARTRGAAAQDREAEGQEGGGS